MGKRNKVVKLTDKKIREHQKNRGGYEVEPILCETILYGMDENQDAPSSRCILAGDEFDAEETEDRIIDRI